MTSGAVPPPIWCDSHCHLHDEEDPRAALERAHQAGVERVVLVGTSEASSRNAQAVAAGLGEGAYATVGLHPHEATSDIGPVAELLDELVGIGPARGRSGSVVGVGECGLDYYYEHSPRGAQRECFAAQIALAKSHDLALVVHTRNAWEDTFAVLEAEGLPERTIIHCFSGDVAAARRCLELGTFLSFSGIVTFKNAADVRDAAIYCPFDSLLIETDAPYLAPVPHRGRPNEPAYVALVGAAIAELRGVPERELAAQTSANAARAFALLP